MPNRVAAFALLAIPACVPLFAQRTLPLRDSSDQRLQAFDLSGTWQAQVGGPLNLQTLQISLRQEGEELTASYSKPDIYVGHIAFHGRYSGQRMFMAKTESSQRAPASDLTVTVTDPDTLIVSGSGIVTYRRFSSPKLNDLPCDRDNPYHVVNYQALARADVAADSGQFSTALCWAFVAADTANPLAQFIVGGYLRKGLGTDRNVQDAFAWLSLSAKQGQLDAQRSLAEMYRFGEGVRPDPALAKYWQDESEETLAAQRRFEQGRQLLNSFTIEYEPPTPRPPCHFPCREPIGAPDLGDFRPGLDPNAKPLPPLVLKGTRAASHVAPVPEERKTVPVPSGPRVLAHFARGQYKIAKDDSRAYITLPGAQQPSVAQFSSDPNVYVIVAWSGRVTALKEVSAPGNLDADGLFSMDMGMDPHIAVRSPVPAHTVLELDGQWDAEVNNGGHSETASMTLHHEGALLWAIESTPGARGFGTRVFSASYSGEKSFPVQLAPEVSGTPGRETTVTLQDADTLLVYRMIFHRVK